MNVRLNETGLTRFKDYIANLKDNPKLEIPIDLLENPETSAPTGFGVEFEQRSFSSRYECGKYVTNRLEEVESRKFVDDAGFWSALALLWFDQLCLVNKRGDRKASMAYNYVLSDFFRHYSRHAIRTSWQLYSQHGKNSQFLLGKEMNVRGELVEQLMGRQYFLSCEGVIGAANRLYLDENTGSFKKGAGSRKAAGCISRYIRWLQQIERTHDLFSIDSDDLYNMLPTEFGRFKAD